MPGCTSEICCKGEGHFTDILFPMVARVFDDYNAKSDAVGNRPQAAGLPGNAAGFTFDDVHHMMTTTVGLVFDRWTNGVDASAWKKKFDDETSRFVNRECGELLKALGLRGLGSRVLSSLIEAIQDVNKPLSI